MMKTFEVKTLKQVVNDHVYACLVFNNFNKTRTAKMLKVSVKSVFNKLSELRNLGYDLRDMPAPSKPAKKTNDNKIRIAISEKDLKLEPIKKEPLDDEFFGMATNEERLKHADDMINKNYL